MRRLLLLSSLITLISLQAQNNSYRLPLDLPVSLSGNFGELRATHFHTGLDFKTQQTIGHPVHAVNDGTIARVAISLYGYGWVVYINHPDGNTSVYGHLSKFSNKIDSLVKQRQYELKQFTVDIDFSSYNMTVKKGEVIAFSGNTGGSEGPHLHFEIRNTETQHPVNVLREKAGWIYDRKPPIIKGIMVYASEVEQKREKKYFPTSLIPKKTNTYELNQHPKPILAYGDISFGIETYDVISGSSNKCGVYSIKVRIDSLLIYESRIDEMSFDEARYIHSFVDYSYRKKTKQKIQRTHVDTNNKLGIYNLYSKDWKIDTLKHNVEIEVLDANNNRSSISFYIKGQKKLNLSPTSKPQIGNPFYVAYNKNISFNFDSCSIFIPANALFNDLDSFEYKIYNSKIIAKNQVTPEYCLNNILTPPLLKEATLKTRIPLLLKEYKTKLYWGRVEGGKCVSTIIPTIKDDSIQGSIRFWGNYALFIDTIPPTITPTIDINKGNISFVIRDDGSGIKSYNGYVDGVWKLFAYEPKKNLLYIEPNTFKKTNTKHKIIIKIEDYSGNLSIKENTFIY